MIDDNNDEYSTLLNPGPRISFPGEIPTTGFHVNAQTPSGIQGASSWRLQVWGSSDPHYWHGSGDRISFWIAPGDIKPGQFRMRCDYRFQGFWSNWTETPWLTMPLAKPTILSPAKNSVIWSKRPAVSGTGVPGAQVQLYQAGVGTVLLGQAPVQNNGHWRIPELRVDLWMADPFNFTARQSKDNRWSDWADTVPTAVLFKPVIGSISVNAMKPTISGSGGLADARLEIWLSGGSGGVQLSTDVKRDGTWTVTSPTAWPVKKYFITAKQIGKTSGKSSDWATVETFEVKPPKPAISPPPNPATAKQVLTITGVYTGTVTLKMLNKAGANVAGNFSTTGTTRTFSPTENWAPGTNTVKVVQTVNGVASDPSELCTFTAKPPKPSISRPPNLAGPRQGLIITGVITGTVTLRVLTEADANVAGDFSIGGTTRGFTPTANWVPGTNTIKVVQTVGGVASDPSELCTFTAKPPKPVITPPPNPAAAKQVLTITGVSSGTVTLKMLNEMGADVVGNFSTAGTTRTFTPTANWAPPINMVKVVQTVNGVASDPSELCTFVALLPNPVIDKPAYEELTGPTPTATGTGLVGATVTLKVGEDEVLSTGVQTDGSWTGVTTPLPPGVCRMYAVQTLNGHSSGADAVVRHFRVQPPKPAISSPPNPATAQQELTITGVHSGAVTLVMFNKNSFQIPGNFSGTGTTRTFTPTANWATGTNTVKVVQYAGGVPSDPSELCTFAVKPPKPAITPPPNPTAANQILTITGVSSGTVTLEMFNAASAKIPGTFSTTGTTRTFTPTEEWAPGTNTVKVVQTVGGVASDPSELCTFAVKPPKPAITPPPNPTAANQILTITGVSSGTVTLEMFNAASAKIPGTFSTTGTTRTFTPTEEWAPGTNTVKVVQTVNGMPSDPSVPCTFAVKPAKPAITQPSHPAEPNQALTITGVSSSTVTLEMFNEADTKVPGNFSGTGTTRTFTPTEEWAPGTNTVKVVQTVNGVASDPSEECTFTVEQEDKPEAPQFERPQAYTRTSTRPTIRVKGLPLAQITVRLEDSVETLHSGPADAEGILEFTVVTPLAPGSNDLEVKQKSGGPESDWSGVHTFIVKEPPKTPVIITPENHDDISRRPLITGSGETRGQIQLRHEDEPEEVFATITGVQRWRWGATERWNLGTYTIQARQTDDGDHSEWTEPRTFNVVDSRYGVGDAGPVLGQPVVGTEQSVLLRVQIRSGDTGEVAEGVKVEWRIRGEQDVIATTETDPQGWTRYLYTPDTAGKHEVLADITSANQGVLMTQLFEVTALSHDAWAQQAEVYLDGERVNLAKGDLVLLRGKPHELELRVNRDSPLIGSSVTLHDLWGAAELDLKCVPDLGTPQPVEEGKPVRWSIFSEAQDSGFFGLNLTSPALPDWQLPGRVESGDFAEALDVDFDGFPKVFGGDPAYPCHGATHTFTVRPKSDSPLLGKHVTLELTQEAADLGVIVSPGPDAPQKIRADGVSWTLDCASSSKNGDFAVRLKVQEWDFSSSELPMSLGHNKVEITEKFGPQEWGGSASYWRYGIRATSTFTGQPAARVPVTVLPQDVPPIEMVTAGNGWCYIQYYSEAPKQLRILNRYDGSTA